MAIPTERTPLVPSVPGEMLILLVGDLGSRTVRRLPQLESIEIAVRDALDRARLHGDAISGLLCWARVLRRRAHREQNIAFKKGVTVC